MKSTSVLFICGHNSARSRMAEAFLNQIGGDAYKVESAGFEPAPVNPFAAEVMNEIGLNISVKEPQKVFDLFKAGRHYQYVVTVCDDSLEKKCPIFPGVVKRCHWSFEDPAGFKGTREEILQQTRTLRDKIRSAVELWMKNPDDCCPIR